MIRARFSFLAVLASCLVAAAGYGQTRKGNSHISPQSTSEYIVDGGFEQATAIGNSAPGWTATTNVSGNWIIWTGPVAGALPHTGNNYAYLGGFSNEEDTLAQTVSIPSNATSALLSFWASVSTSDSGGINDTMNVEVWDLAGNILGTPLTLSNEDAFRDNNTIASYFHVTNVDLTSYAGQTVQIAFHDFSSPSTATNFLIDDVSLQVTTGSPSGGCVADATTLCLDNNPGDQRFQVTVTFATSQGGGSSGSGQAIPLSSLGVTHGGLFWFFSPTNPELLVKVLNGCGVNNKFWIFASAGTNVGVVITVVDTLTGAQAVYTNPDLQAMIPIQDTSAFSCP